MKKSKYFLILYLFAAILSQGTLFSQSLTPSNFRYTEQVVDALKALEGYRDHVYLDNNNNPIFGYGHLVTEKELPSLQDDFGYETLSGKETEEKSFTPPVNKLSEAEKMQTIEEYLRKDIDITLEKMKKNITVSLTQYQVDALVIYLFWRGANELNADVQELYDLINAQKHEKVIDFIKNRPKSDQTYLPGNRRRNAKTAELYRTGEFPFIWY
ncbi:MAG: hypothetical protein AAF518_24435 [Spirochaetota bacterium]